MTSQQEQHQPQMAKIKLDLPNEILYRVLSYIDAEDLLPWRSLSRSWNEIASYHIFHKKLPVKFLHKIYENEGRNYDTKVENLLDTMNSRLAESMFPFSAYEFYLFQSQVNTEEESSVDAETFYPSMAYINKFAIAVGSAVKSYSLHMEHFYEGDLQQILESLLQHAPNLETLCVYGQNTKASTSIFLNSSFNVPKLKNIVIMPYSPEISWMATDSDHVGPSRIPFQQFSSWISNAPTLQILKTGFGVEVQSIEEGSDFFKLIENFDFVELEFKKGDEILLETLTSSPLSTLKSLFLDLELDVALVTACLNSLSNTLRKLSILVHGRDNLIPELVNLETLELNFDEQDWDNPIEQSMARPLQAAQFPKLKNFTLYRYRDSEKSDENWTLFDGSIFESVEHLKLVKCNRSSPECWDRLFPNAKVKRTSDSTDDDEPEANFPTNTKSISMRQLNVRAILTQYGPDVLPPRYYENF